MLGRKAWNRIPATPGISQPWAPSPMAFWGPPYIPFPVENGGSGSWETPQAQGIICSHCVQLLMPFCV